MWMGSPLLTSSVVKILRKSWAVKVSPVNSGLVCARARQGRCSMRWTVWADSTARDVPSFRWNKNGIGLLQTRSCLS